MSTPPSAFKIMDKLAREANSRGLAVFLDYDGTLTPIVPRPEDAVLTEAMREAVRELSKVCTVAIVSGRELRDVQNLVGLNDLPFAGDHGFNIEAPGIDTGYSPADEQLPRIREALDEVKEAVSDIPGAWVEEKTYTFTVHYRQTPEEHTEEVERIVSKAAKDRGLRLTSGKKVFEIRPGLEWHKGYAVNWLRKALGVQEAFPVYVGDDTTDEDAFKALEGEGMGILVTDEPVETAAAATLEDTEQTRRFLEELKRVIEERD
jgi:alpha,alpha-trehalase